MAGTAISMALGYTLGAFHPAAIISIFKKKNLKENGTGNLGATNTMLVFGKWLGILVMVLDILKAFVAVRLARALYPALPWAGLLAGLCAIVGHMFPIFLRFQGGKGLACFGGMLLAHDPGLFLILLLIGIALMLITNYGVAMPFSAASLAPILGGLRAHSWGVFSLLLAAGGLVIFKHRENIGKIKDGTELRTRDVLAGRAQVKIQEEAE